MTKSSPVIGIKENVLWLETSLTGSINENQASDGVALTTWNDQSTSTKKPSIAAVNGGPTYSNTINGVHAVKFANAGYLEISDASFLNNTDYTIIILEKRFSTNAGYFIGDSTLTTQNQTLLLGYGTDGTITHSQGTGNSYESQIAGYNSSNNAARVITFVSDSANGKKTYINGVLSSSSADTSKLSNISTLAIGKTYNGEIGELAIFTRPLKAEERKSVEDYLGKKWSSKILRDTVANGSCTTGTITTTGCSMDCSTASIAGVSSPSTVTDGQTGVTATCGATGGTFTYTCNTDSNLSAITNSCIVPPPLSCTGGDEVDTTTISGKKIHKFTTVGNGTFSCTGQGTAQILVVGGGGQVVEQSISVNAQNLSITVGGGNGGKKPSFSAGPGNPFKYYSKSRGLVFANHTINNNNSTWW